MTDDGFINVRVVHQLLAGNGPVFNAGERVEATTSPLWLSCLVLGKLLFFWLPVEWVAVVLGIVTTLGAVALAVIAARSAYGTARLLPIGVLAYVVLPPAAEFATSGLEMGLSLLWMSVWYVLLLHAADRPDGRSLSLAALVVGLGPLIRPDFAVISLLAGATVLALNRSWTVRRLGAIAGAALALPASYQLFRMCYYGNLLPNTAYVKEATTANWPQGWQYLRDFSQPYWLWVAGIAVLVAALASRRQVPKTRRIVFVTPLVVAAVYGTLIVRGGGDFMHARMLLPAVFAAQLPVAAVPVRRSVTALFVAILLWAAVPLRAGGPPYKGVGPAGITNERDLYVGKLDHPITIDDYASNGLVMLGRGARERSEQGQRNVDDFGVIWSASQPLDPHAPAFAQRGVYAIAAIGMVSVAAGTNIYIADHIGLASPIASRLQIAKRGRPGHEKSLPPSWIFAMFGDPEAPAPKIAPADAIHTARQALACPAIQRMLARAREPLTLRRMARNFAESFTDFTTRIDPDPSKELARCSAALTDHTP